MPLNFTADTWTEPTLGEIVQELGLPAPTFLDLARRIAAAPVDLLAIEYRDDTVTYGDMTRRIAAAVAHLEVLGVGRGDHVAILLRPRPNSLLVYLAITMMGAVVVPIYWESAPSEVLDRVRRFDVSTVITEPDRTAALEEYFERPAVLRQVVVLPGAFEEEMLAGADISPLLARDYPAPLDPALITQTSGTTGQPKGVVQYNTFSAAGFFLARKVGVTPPVKTYLCTSLGHGSALFTTAMAFWLNGSVVLPPRFSASAFWDDIRRHRVTYVHMLGSMPSMLLGQPPRPNDTEHTLEVCVSSGLAGSPAVWEEFEARFGVRICEFYGSTDGGGVWLYNPHGLCPAPSVGQPWLEFEAKIVNDFGDPVAVGEVGELMTKPKGRDSVVAYYNDPEEARTKVHDGWVATGDWFRQDEDGNFFFVDRKRDIIRRRGIGIPPALIEAALSRHPEVAAVGAFAVPSPLGEDDVKVVVQARSAGLDPLELLAFAQEALSRHMHPRYIEITTAPLPLTEGSARVQRFQLRDRWRTPSTYDVEKGSYLEVAPEPTPVAATPEPGARP